MTSSRCEGARAASLASTWACQKIPDSCWIRRVPVYAQCLKFLRALVASAAEGSCGHGVSLWEETALDWCEQTQESGCSDRSWTQREHEHMIALLHQSLHCAQYTQITTTTASQLVLSAVEPTALQAGAANELLATPPPQTAPSL